MSITHRASAAIGQLIGPPQYTLFNFSNISSMVFMPGTLERAKLEKKYRNLLEEDFRYGKLVTFVLNKKEPIHRWFPYKQGFSKRLIEKIVKDYKITQDKIIFDPFNGIGTTTLAASQLGYSSIGLELLPFADFMAQVKLTNAIDFDEFKKERERIEKAKFGGEIKSLPDIKIMDAAFDKKTAGKLIGLKKHIDKLKNKNIKNLFLLAFYSSIEGLSYTSKDGQFLRIVEKEIPSVKKTFLDALDRIESDLHLEKIKLIKNPRGKPKLLLGDARRIPLKDSTVDIVITSPPYLNRYDYSRIYCLELAFGFVKNFDELKKIRHSLLRSHIESKESLNNHVCEPALNEILDELSKKKLNNPRIPIMIKGYFEDIFLVIKELYRVLNKGGKVFIVVGNVRFSGELIPVDLLLSDIAKKIGFNTEKIIICRYKGNSSQQMNSFGRVPVRESILVWAKNG